MKFNSEAGESETQLLYSHERKELGASPQKPDTVINRGKSPIFGAEVLQPELQQNL